MVVNMYAPNRGASQYIRQRLTAIKEEMNSNTIIVTKVGNFNTSLSSMGRSSREKINKETLALNDTLDQTDLMDIYRAIQTKAAGHTFLSSAQGTFSRNDHMQTFYHKASLSKFKKTEVISTIFSNHKAVRLEINYKKKTIKKHEHVEAKQYASKQPKVH